MLTLQWCSIRARTNSKVFPVLPACARKVHMWNRTTQGCFPQPRSSIQDRSPGSSIKHLNSKGQKFPPIHSRGTEKLKAQLAFSIIHNAWPCTVEGCDERLPRETPETTAVCTIGNDSPGIEKAHGLYMQAEAAIATRSTVRGGRWG